jgi:hypothetical protein
MRDKSKRIVNGQKICHGSDVCQFIPDGGKQEEDANNDGSPDACDVGT